ncbi:MAG: hypothetical protein M1818_004054 [Claussenomyces sp. TS43310]|nr:MAG: hypothetical protein M1818_004054 [Claussenomyces sp. TS43310]
MMDSMNEIDVSWLHNTHSKDSANVHSPRSHPDPRPPLTAHTDSNVLQHKQLAASAPKQIPQRPSDARNGSSEKTPALQGTSTKSASPTNPPTRRNSWMASISSKFSSSPGAHTASPGNNANAPAAKSSTVHDGPGQKSPGGSLQKNTPPPGSKAEGNEPYVPAPPKTAQSGFLHSALRRLSSSSSGQLAANPSRPNHGLCERKVLNVDNQRDRCHIKELESSKLRRVAFCVDVEIAGPPHYIEDENQDDKIVDRNPQCKNKMNERGEGEALKHPDEAKDEKENDGVLRSSGEKLPREPVKEGDDNQPGRKDEVNAAVKVDEVLDRDTTKKKEKKKRSEEERKARKEKKRKQAEANGILPLEVVKNGSDDSLAPASSGPTTPKLQASPTTDPARIYRRCCQLRETPILKKITEQLTSPANSDRYGVVTRIDLSSYWMHLPDLITLGDYLAVVPVKELIMENCGLTDEGVRIVLAGLLAAKSQNYRAHKAQEAGHEGSIERVAFKNNPKIGQQGWRHVSLFIHMSKSLKSMDMSMNPFPQPIPPPQPANHGHLHLHLHRTSSNMSSTSIPDPPEPSSEISCILSKALGERLAGPVLELFNMAETGINTDQLGLLIDGAIKADLRRLGLAQNNITAEGMSHVARYVKHGKCEGLDLGGNDVRDYLEMLAETLDEDHPLWAISLSNCALDPESLWALFSALSKLKNFRFIDLSHNQDLFGAKDNALSLLRKYLPRMPMLKRIHLNDVSMTPEQAIALAETFAESPSLAHVNIMENPEISALASASEENLQEEACALYASLMTAVRVSRSLVCIDIDVPSADSSEIVKALAKQVVAYCLRNMERGPVAEISGSAAMVSDGVEKEVAMPDVLLHLVGHVEDLQDGDSEDECEPAPDQDYMIGGTGVVKALGICLQNSTIESRRPSADRAHSRSGTPTGMRTPRRTVHGKAKDMSKNLLGSARKIRARLQLALIREAQSLDARSNYQRLLFLDTTLERMIKRFEDEYPETRLPARVRASSTLSADKECPKEDSVPSNGNMLTHQNSDLESSFKESYLSDDEGELRPALSRHNSDVSLASRALSQEEGRMHRFGQKWRRELLHPDVEDDIDCTERQEKWAPHLEMLRATLEELGGDELRKKIEAGGPDALLQELNEEASALRQKLIDNDPESWRSFQQAQEAMIKNSTVEGLDAHEKRI